MNFCSRFALFIAVLLQITALKAQQTFPVTAPSDERPGLHAFTNATIYIDYKTRVEGATLLVRDGKVVGSGLNVSVPGDAVVHDCSGMTIYPAFIDLYATGYGLPKIAARQAGFPRRIQTESGKKGAFAWNEALKPEFSAAENFTVDPKAAEAMRKLGFGAVLTHQPDGISRGTGALVSLAGAPEQECLLSIAASHHLSFRKGSSSQTYPVSLMGCIALIRQTYLDSKWYQAGGNKTEKNLSLEAWNNVQRLPQIFEASDKLDILRIARIGKEFNTKYLVKTAGDEYQRLEEVKATGQSLIVPLDFPDNYDVKDPYAALDVSLRDLKHWEMAPSNPGRLEAAGISFALTTEGLKDKKKFPEYLRKAIEYGLSEEMALKALTFNPATFLGVYDAAMRGSGPAVGSLEPGKLANFTITSGDIFQKGTKIYESWVQGEPLQVSTPDPFDQAPERFGEYKLNVGADTYTLIIRKKGEARDVQVLRADSSKVKASLTLEPNGIVTLSFRPDTLEKGQISLSGVAGAREWSGRGTLSDGSWIDWRAEMIKPAGPDKPSRQKPEERPETGAVIYPFIAYGRQEMPRAETVLIRNATVWTNEKAGILQNTDVLVSEGKIQKIGKRLAAKEGVLVVDGSGKHLTAGIIDEHSHIAAVRGINEGTQESSAEVRIGDVINSEDNDIYLQLAGGVTSSHILHGSANPIGGQTQLIKLRWGRAPEELKFQNWPGFIKFALGENVKQSNNSNSNNRYPQTRMGVEQTYVDYFTRAKEYGQLKKSGKPYRTDLELEALLEILESRRFITCHSYVQSEITMLMRVAEHFGFRVNTFTHILEGYKVADKMAKHGVGASTFSDWWDYKYEVYEAIPYNAAIMTGQGVVVAINSDDAEMARRLNQEAAKSVLYGGMKEEDAWKMVTLNPAKLLHVDDRVGSVKEGKDADLVLWNADPLSVYARAEITWVDGVRYFDRQVDAEMQNWIRQERARILQKMQASGKGREGGERPGRPKQHYDCESMDDEG
ncbi:MAG: amidohydrolase family protein [Saprospiraceae bacterium]|nr:amidohydrolase family protein [Saprospiraceae bacterium]